MKYIYTFTQELQPEPFIVSLSPSSVDKVASDLSEDAINEIRLAWPDPNYTFRPAGPDDCRSPFPEIDALANHSYINYDGRNITGYSLISALLQVYGPELFEVGQTTSTDLCIFNALHMEAFMTGACISEDILSSESFDLNETQFLIPLMKTFMPKAYALALSSEPLNVRQAYLKAVSIVTDKHYSYPVATQLNFLPLSLFITTSMPNCFCGPDDETARRKIFYQRVEFVVISPTIGCDDGYVLVGPEDFEEDYTEKIATAA